MDCNIFLLSFKSKKNKDHRKRAYNPNWMSFKPSVSFHKMKNLKKTTMISVLGIPFVEFKSITLHRAIRHFDSLDQTKWLRGDSNSQRMVLRANALTNWVFRHLISAGIWIPVRPCNFTTLFLFESQNQTLQCYDYWKYCRDQVSE